jgi:hypothetical protein
MQEQVYWGSEQTENLIYMLKASRTLLSFSKPQTQISMHKHQI